MIDPSSIDLSGAPFGGNQRLVDVVMVEFRTEFVKHACEAERLNLAVGDQVIVDTKRGPAIGKVVTPKSREVVPKEQHTLKIVRRASEADLETAVKNEAWELSAHKFAVGRIRERRLDMKLVRVQAMHDGSKLVFFFSANGRIDFRDLVKDLAHQFRTRIEMFQIGIREGARMVGGIGSCGRELCCSTFLTNFAPVSIRMAKDQGLSLNPTNISGQCGRLMCCLVYEQQVYRRMKTRLPRAKQTVYTESGSGVVVSVDIIGQKVTIRTEDSQHKVVALENLSLEKPAEKKAPPPSKPGYLWEDEEKPKKKRRRRRKKKPAGDSNSNQGKTEKQNSGKKKKSGGAKKKSSQSNSGNAQGQKKSEKPKNDKPKTEGDAPKKKRRRRRRKKKPTDKPES